MVAMTFFFFLVKKPVKTAPISVMVPMTFLFFFFFSLAKKPMKTASIFGSLNMRGKYSAQIRILLYYLMNKEA